MTLNISSANTGNKSFWDTLTQLSNHKVITKTEAAQYCGYKSSAAFSQEVFANQITTKNKALVLNVALRNLRKVKKQLNKQEISIRQYLSKYSHDIPSKDDLISDDAKMLLQSLTIMANIQGHALIVRGSNSAPLSELVFHQYAPRTVDKALQELIDAGDIDIVASAEKGKCDYRLLRLWK